MEIDSEAENTALVDEITRRGYGQKRMNFWIGLTDLGSEGDWRLASNGLKPSFENWHPGQPDRRDCARIRIGPLSSWKDTWSDLKCGLSLGYYTNISPYWEFSMHAICEFVSSKEIQEVPLSERPSTEGDT